MGSVGAVRSNSNFSYWPSERDFMNEASRQGMDGEDLQNGLEEYTTSSYGGVQLGNQISKFIENAPESMMYNGGTLYRGLFFESQRELDSFLNSHKVGATLKTRPDGLSWTADNSVAQSFSTEVSDHSVILVNDDKNRIAMGIKNIADTPISSFEVLYSNKVDFKVSKIENKDGVIYMHVKQNRSKR